MNKIIKLLGGILVTVILMACGRTNDNNSNSNIENKEEEYCIADIDGVETEFNAAIYYAKIGKKIAIDAPSKEGVLDFKRLGIYFLDGKTGEFDLKSNTYYAEIINGKVSAYSLKTGKVNVTKNNDNWVEGTFEFTGENSKGETVKVTNGKFLAEK